MIEAKTVVPLRITWNNFGLQKTEKQMIASIVFGLFVYLGPIHLASPMTIDVTSYEAASRLLAAHPDAELATTDVAPYIRLRSERQMRRITVDTLDRLHKDGYSYGCIDDVTSIALLLVGFLSGLGMFRFLVATDLALDDIRSGKFRKSRYLDLLRLCTQFMAQSSVFLSTAYSDSGLLPSAWC